MSGGIDTYKMDIHNFSLESLSQIKCYHAVDGHTRHWRIAGTAEPGQ